MILPIVAYGDPVLNKEAELIDKSDTSIQPLISNMFETMYAASGVGLAAPQVGVSKKLFIIDASPFSEDDKKEYEHLKDFKKVFINPEILSESGDEWGFEEGCLSIPSIREEVSRMPEITIKYFDENFVEYTEHYDGVAARIIQHEYDHLMGILFIEHLNPLKRRLLKRKLTDISKGDVSVSYKMKFPLKKR
jgi:peptide deformylase